MTDEPRVGVFVCACGSNIGGVVDVPEVAEYARGLDHVTLVDEGRWSCSVDYLSKLQDLIREHELNRVVIASCTPRTHEPLFKASVKKAGLNPYLLEFVSIREQSSWVHMHEPDAATAKAKDLVAMGVAKAALLEEGYELRLPVGTECLVIGGGVAGMTAALNVADQGFHATVVERQPQLGGLLTRLASVTHAHATVPAVEVVAGLGARVEAHPGITVHTGTEVESVQGYVGAYEVVLRPGEGEGIDLRASTVIVATGMDELEPEGWYRWGEDPRIITQVGLESLLRDGDLEGRDDVVIIGCVDSKNEKRGCCSIGCFVSTRNALAIARARPEARVSVLYRDLSLLDEEGSLAEEARRAGVRFLRFPDDQYPVLEDRPDGSLVLRVHDLLLGAELTVPADLVVLTPGYRGNESVDRVRGLLKVSASPDGFFQEAHIKLGPLEFASSGVYLAGCARNPKTVKESVEEGMGAAMRASIPMRRGYVEADGIVADIDLDPCSRCGLCSKKCPYGAIRVDEVKTPDVIKALCKGCGLCVADCPSECITLVHYSDEQLLAQVDAALEHDADQKILGFVCHWCALGGVDMAGVSRLQYPTNGRLVRVMCSARVSHKMVMRAFERGAAGVLVAGCEFPTCHYITGNYEAEKRLVKTRRKLAKAGHDPEKLWNLWCSAADGPKFAAAMHEMVGALGLGDGDER